MMDYSKLVDAFVEIQNTSKRLKKTQIISKFIRNCDSKDLEKILLLLQGQIFAPWDKRKLGVAARIVLKAINISTGTNTKKVEDMWRKTGDLGIATSKLIDKKKQVTLFSTKLTLDKVFSNLEKLAGLEGLGTVDRKVKLIAELLTSASPSEAQYIVRTVLEDIRVGVGEGSLRDAIVLAYYSEELNIEYDEEKNKLILEDDNREEYNKYIETVQEAFDITSDFGKIARIIKDNIETKSGLTELKKLNLVPGKPLKVMLVQKAQNATEALERVGTPAAFEYKYDGFRLQIHKNKDEIRLFTRNLEDVTKQFPDVVEYVKEFIKADSIILDSEAVGINKKTGGYLPFQSISQRIRRKYEIDKIKEDFPVEANIFDILFLDGKNLLKTPFNERRDLLKQNVIQKKGKFVLAEQFITDNAEEGNEFYNKALDSGNEGVIVKNLESIYKPGSRVGFCVKIKPVMDSLELVIVAAEWGDGKRSGWLTSLTLACLDDNGELLEIGKVSTGLKELSSEGTSFEDMTKLLKPSILTQEGKNVTLKPEIVIEVNYEEIQSSNNYSSGYALRFPRFIRLREDRSLNDIDSIDSVEELYSNQRNR
jgi:DNA ligase 1